MAENFYYDKIRGGGVKPVVSKGVILQAGHIYVRGTVLAFVSSSNGIETLAPLSSSAAAPGNIPYAVVADPIVDATNGAQSAAAEFEGEYNADALIFQGTDTVDQFITQLKDAGMIVKTVIEGREQ